MTAYTTCTGCARDPKTCEFRQQIRTAILGLGVTSIRFKCPIREAAFPPGQRVIVGWPLDDRIDEYGHEKPVRFYATVLAELKPGRYRVKVDDGRDIDGAGYDAPDDLRSEGYANVSIHRLTRVEDEPRLTVCPSCEDIYEQGALNRCRSSSYFRPADCLRRSLAEAG